MRSPNFIKVLPFYRLRDEFEGSLPPAFELGLNGPRCEVEVGLDEEYLNSYKLMDLEAGVKRGLCLFDTGADNTAIDVEVARELNLKPVGGLPVKAAFGGSSRAPMYAFTLKLKGYEFSVSQAPAFSFRGEGFIAIIGRDVLYQGDMSYQGRAGNWGFDMPVTPGK